MRKVTKQAATMLIQHQTTKNRRTLSHNTFVMAQAIYLFGHKIIERQYDNIGQIEYHLTLCGYNTVTTRERLNGFLDMLSSSHRFYTRQGTLFLSDFGAIDASDTFVFDERGKYLRCVKA